MKIGVLSDSHVPRRGAALPPEIWTSFAGVDLILHAGDLVEEKVLLDLKALAPVEAVAGNMDGPDLRYQLNRKKILFLGGKRIGLIHGDGGVAADQARQAFAQDPVDCIVFGHSHQAMNRREGGVLMFNPGSCTDPRGGEKPSIGFLYIDEQGIRGEIRYLNSRL